MGGEVLEEVLRFIFHRIGPAGMAISRRSNYTFPGEQALMAIVAYGFAAFIIIRYSKKGWKGVTAAITAIIICIVSGLSSLYLNTHNPSDVIAGYVFGGIWLSLNIMLLEIFRILPQINNHLSQNA